MTSEFNTHAPVARAAVITNDDDAIFTEVGDTIRS